MPTLKKLGELAASVAELRGKNLYAAARVPVYYVPGEDQQAWAEIEPGGFIGRITGHYIERPSMRLWWKFDPAGFARKEYYVQHNPAAFDVAQLEKQGVNLKTL